MKRIKNRLSRAWQKGVVTIEFALGFFAFWLLIAAWTEMSYIAYVTSIGDLAVSEASRLAKKDTENYITVFKDELNNSDAFWSKFVNSENFTVSVRYVKDLDELKAVTEVCIPDPDDSSQTITCGGGEEDKAIAIYYVSYHYDSIFGYFDDEGGSVFAREIIVVQEYERDQFEI